ncbi:MULTISPECIES: TadE/TadG family type IV pilus assembly protein [unclassified Rhizobium]|uniref:TadE/TadG family type IV pilus assembly protein n=1 Tax=unclassified Rhizobium TaxID=2613769 RepID=UPI001ADB0D00|nr:MULTISPECIES: TadE/TadG family type IV pilus assembly protein [unclassified Rhizobium]MBO9122842.1 pilus assembly protein [Rhizobium sp. 16-488-2b]MBO9173374.1 pilus assembly protein [Rhizobium sp. 16-488-2a]
MFKHAFSRLIRERSGASAIEFALLAPILLFFFLASITVFDMYRTYQNIVQANGIVADVISRQTSIDNTFVSNLYSVFTHLQQNSTAPIALRISSIKKTAGVYKLDWTKESGTAGLLKAQVLSSSTLPQLTDGDSVIYVEGAARYTAMTSIMGFGSMTFAETAFSRPRFIGAIVYQ